MSSGLSKKLIYDGSCGFCTNAAQWLNRRIRDTYLSVETSQEITDSELTELGLTRAEVNAALWFVDGHHRYRRSHAVARALRSTTAPLSILGLALDLPPLRWIFAVIYWFVAKNRHRLPGGTPQCAANGIVTPR